MSAPLVAVVLAAGRARRYGADKRWLAMPDGTPMALSSALVCVGAVARVLAVVRADDDALRARLAGAGIDSVACARAARGMGASLACGVRASADARGWLIVLADMPWVRPATVRVVAEALRAGARLAAPWHAGRRGHPVGFAAHWRDELLALDGDAGAGALVERERAHVHALEVDDPGCLRDVDTPADTLAAAS